MSKDNIKKNIRNIPRYELENRRENLDILKKEVELQSLEIALTDKLPSGITIEKLKVFFSCLTNGIHKNVACNYSKINRTTLDRFMEQGKVDISLNQETVASKFYEYYLYKESEYEVLNVLQTNKLVNKKDPFLDKQLSFMSKRFPKNWK